MKGELRPRCRGYSQLVEAVDLFRKHKDPATKGLSHGKEELEAAGAPLPWHLESVYMPVMTYTKAGRDFHWDTEGNHHSFVPAGPTGPPLAHLQDGANPTWSRCTPEQGTPQVTPQSRVWLNMNRSQRTDTHGKVPLASTKGLLPSNSSGGTPKAAGPGKTGWSLIGQSPTGAGSYLPLIGQ